jgi:hypothetical protein
LEEFGSRQSGISGTQKDQNAISSFYEELANDSKSGSLWLSIFSQAVVHQGIQLNGAVINSKDDPVFKSEAFKAAFSLFLRISGFVGFCCSVPDTPDYTQASYQQRHSQANEPREFRFMEEFFSQTLRNNSSLPIFRTFYYLTVSSVSALLHHLLLLTGLPFLAHAVAICPPLILYMRDGHPAHLHKGRTNL